MMCLLSVTRGGSKKEPFSVRGTAAWRHGLRSHRRRTTRLNFIDMGEPAIARFEMLNRLRIFARAVEENRGLLVIAAYLGGDGGDDCQTARGDTGKCGVGIGPLHK